MLSFEKNFMKVFSKYFAVETIYIWKTIQDFYSLIWFKFFYFMIIWI